MSQLILGLHGSFEEIPARGVHDAAYCLADMGKQKIIALVEAEKHSGVRHDGRLNQALLKTELASFCGETRQRRLPRPAVGEPGRLVLPQEPIKCHEATMQMVSSHFTTFGNYPAHEFPLFRNINSLGWNNLRFCSKEQSSFFGSKLTHYVYLHELAHVFSAFMYREQDHERFLGLVIEGCGSFAQNALFLIDNFRVELLESMVRTV